MFILPNSPRRSNVGLAWGCFVLLFNCFFMMTLVFISMAVFLVYTIGVCIAFRCIPYSISDTFYKLKEKWDLGGLFTIFCWCVGFSLLPYLLEHEDACPQIIRFLAVVGLILVGAAPYFKGWDRTAHIVGASMCIVCSQVWAFTVCWWIPLMYWIAWIAGTAIYMGRHQTGILERTFVKAKPMFWIEIAAFASVFTTIFVS